MLSFTSGITLIDL